MSEARAIRHVVVAGRVQGIGFRAWVQRQAQTRHLDGFVRNRRDGTVEAVFAGPAAAVADMIAACRRGPPLARVERLDDSEADAAMLAEAPAGDGFALLPTV